MRTDLVKFGLRGCDSMSTKSKNQNFDIVLSPTTENYLLTIFRMNELGEKITQTELAERLKSVPSHERVGTTLPSVRGMINRMTKEGLVKTDQNKEIVLTQLGNHSAETIVRRHRLCECMVVELLGLELYKAHEQAHRLEHAITPELEEKIVSRLGNPTTCPFGHPIPGSGYKAKNKSMSLDTIKVGSKLKIDRVPEDDQNLLKYFVDNDLMPNKSITVTKSERSLGVITLNTENNTDVVFSFEIAKLIHVTKS